MSQVIFAAGYVLHTMLRWGELRMKLQVYFRIYIHMILSYSYMFNR